MIDLRPDDDLPDADHLANVHSFCAPFLTCGPVPDAFTRDHLGLMPGSQPWLAALVRAALARYLEQLGIGAPVPREMRAASVAISRAMNELGIRPGPSHAEMVRRRDWHARAVERHPV